MRTNVGTEIRTRIASTAIMEQLLATATAKAASRAKRGDHDTEGPHGEGVC